MDHLVVAGETGTVRLGFDWRELLELHNSKIGSDDGLLLFWELDEVLGLHDIPGGLLRDARTGHNRLHTLVRLLRQVVEGRAVESKAASASQMGRFEAQVLAKADNRVALAEMSGRWIDLAQSATAPKSITLEKDSSVVIAAIHRLRAPPVPESPRLQ